MPCAGKNSALCLSTISQAWMLGVRPGWTALSVDGQVVQTKELIVLQMSRADAQEDIEDALQAAVEREKRPEHGEEVADSRRYTVCFEKGQGKFGTEACRFLT